MQTINYLKIERDFKSSPFKNEKGDFRFRKTIKAIFSSNV